MTSKRTSQGTNAERAKLSNRQAVLGHIHSAGVMGRAEIARTMGLSTQAVSNIIAELAQDGLLVEKGTRTAGRGLPAVQYGVNPEGGFSFGIEIRPTAIFAALLNMHGQPVFTQRVPLTDARPDIVVALVVGLRNAAIKAVPAAAQKLLGAGIVMPGPFGRTGLSGRSSDLPEWQSVDPTALFEEALNLPIMVSNDANAAAMAERITGVAHALQSYAYLYFGTGIGLGLVSQGHLIPGAFGNAGEIGQLRIPVNSELKPLESVLSRMSVQNYLSEHGHPVLDFEGIAKLYDEKNPALLAWIDTASCALEHIIPVIENLFDPQSIILGGAMPEAILNQLVSKAALPILSVSNRPDSEEPRLRTGASGRLTATLGAAALILNRTYTPQLSVTH